MRPCRSDTNFATSSSNAAPLAIWCLIGMSVSRSALSSSFLPARRSGLADEDRPSATWNVLDGLEDWPLLDKLFVARRTAEVPPGLRSALVQKSDKEHGEEVAAAETQDQQPLGDNYGKSPSPKVSNAPSDPHLAFLSFGIFGLLTSVLNGVEQIERLPAGSHSRIDSVLDLQELGSGNQARPARRVLLTSKPFLTTRRRLLMTV